jgi:hypothetical protein
MNPLWIPLLQVFNSATLSESGSDLEVLCTLVSEDMRGSVEKRHSHCLRIGCDRQSPSFSHMAGSKRRIRESRKIAKGGTPMLPGHRCENCSSVVVGSRAGHPRTRYCVRCAKLRKNTRVSLGQPRMARHSATSRTCNRHPERCSRTIRDVTKLQGGSQTPVNPFEAVRTGIVKITVIALELAGLVMILTLCVKHLLHLLQV